MLSCAARMRSLTFERSTSMRLKEPFLIPYWALYGAGGLSIARRSVADDLEELLPTSAPEEATALDAPSSPRRPRTPGRAAAGGSSLTTAQSVPRSFRVSASQLGSKSDSGSKSTTQTLDTPARGIAWGPRGRR
jgi:hypothetical protein